MESVSKELTASGPHVTCASEQPQDIVLPSYENSRLSQKCSSQHCCSSGNPLCRPHRDWMYSFRSSGI